MQDGMWKTILEIKTCLQSENLQDCALKYRKSFLVVAGILGVIPATATYYLIGCLGLNEGTLRSNLTILALGLPIFFTLWLFRTHDVQRQIDKTQGQIDITQEQINITQEQVDKAQKQIDITQESIHNNFFFECVRMLVTKESFPMKMALEQLSYLKRETKFDKKRIDYLTQNISLEGKNFKGARLNDLDLSNANLRAAHFDKAVYNLATKFPKGFYPEEEGMVYEQDIEF